MREFSKMNAGELNAYIHAGNMLRDLMGKDSWFRQAVVKPLEDLMDERRNTINWKPGEGIPPAVEAIALNTAFESGFIEGMESLFEQFKAVHLDYEAANEEIKLRADMEKKTK